MVKFDNSRSEGLFDTNKHFNKSLSLFKTKSFSFNNDQFYLTAMIVISISLLFTLLFVGSELLVELGVNVREACVPNFELGPIISRNNSIKNTKELNIAMHAGFLHRTKFLDGQLDYLPAGFPRNITDKICTTCLRQDFPPDNSSNVILEGCTLTEYKQYNRDELDIGIHRTPALWGTRTSGFAERDWNGKHARCYCGHGDLTLAVHENMDDNRSYSTFLFSNPKKPYIPQNGTCDCSSNNSLDSSFDDDQNADLLYFEYNNQSHIAQLLQHSFRNSTEFWQPIQSVTYVQNISCTQNFISMSAFTKALSVVTSLRRENSIAPTQLNKTTGRFPSIENADIYVAGLSHKLAESYSMGGRRPMGRYRIYDICGTFDIRYAIPSLISALVIVMLWIFSDRLLRKSRLHDNAQILESTEVRGTDLGDACPGIPLYHIGTPAKLNVTGEDVRSRQERGFGSQKIVAIRDRTENIVEFRVVPHNYIYEDADIAGGGNDTAHSM